MPNTIKTDTPSTQYLFYTLLQGRGVTNFFFTRIQGKKYDSKQVVIWYGFWYEKSFMAN